MGNERRNSHNFNKNVQIKVIKTINKCDRQKL